MAEYSFLHVYILIWISLVWNVLRDVYRAKGPQKHWVIAFLWTELLLRLPLCRNVTQTMNTAFRTEYIYSRKRCQDFCLNNKIRKQLHIKQKSTSYIAWIYFPVNSNIRKAHINAHMIIIEPSTWQWFISQSAQCHSNEVLSLSQI